jgi:uncharacterized protein (DUF58 family)
MTKNITSAYVLRAALLLAVVFIAGISQSQAQQMRFTIEDVQASYRVGEPILLTWRITNGSTRPFSVLAAMQTPARLDFDPIMVKISRLADSDSLPGMVFSLTGARDAVHKVLCELMPGASLSQQFDLSMFADLFGVRLKPGQYQLRAEYDLGRTVILSDEERLRSFTESLAAPTVVITITP